MLNSFHHISILWLVISSRKIDLVRFVFPSDEKSENYHESFSTLVEQTAKGNQVGKPFSISDNSKTDNEEEPKSYRGVRNRYGSSGPESSQDIQQDDETSNLYLM